MLQLVFFCVYLFLSIYSTATHTSEETVCGSAYLKGPLDKTGRSSILLPVTANMSSGYIVIKCQLNRTNLNVSYNLRLRIYHTIDGKASTLREHAPNSDHRFDKEGEGNIIKYAVNIPMHERLHKSIITCGAGYEISPGVGHEYCYTGSAALITIEDYDSCDPPTTATPTTPNNPTTMSHSMPTPMETPVATVTDSNSSQTPTNIPTTLDTPSKIDTTAAYITLPTAAEICMEKDTFFSAVGIVVLVGIVLLSANFIQLYVIIKRRRVAATATDLPDKRGERNDNAFDPRDRRGIELEEVLENSMAKESG